MSDTAFLVAIAAAVIVGVVLRRLLPRDGFTVAPEAEAEQAAGRQVRVLPG